MKRLIFSGLLSLAAVSCGSSDKLKDVKAYFCNGSTVKTGEDNKDNLTSCHGNFWADVKDKAACEAQVAKFSGKPEGAADDAKETTIDKWTDAERAALIKESDTAKFKTSDETIVEACKLVGIAKAS